jgi:hypothetical protein
MGVGALLTMIGNGFDIVLALNFSIFFGCALYGTPQLIKLFTNNAGTMGRTNFAELGLQSRAFGGFDRSEWHDIFDI